MRSRAASFTVLALLVSAVFPGCEKERYFLEDAQGRQMVLHGLNISNSAKSDPDGVGWHAEADYARMVDWGFNAVRLLIFWSHLEPAEGVFDEAYLDRVEERVGWARSHGLYVILDMHQDVYGRKFLSDGAPAWAARDDGFPYEQTSPWWANYLSPAVCAAFSHLWNDADLQQHYIDVWSRVARRFAGNPAVIGYDLMNEPYFGNESLFSFEADKLHPFYGSVLAAIRSQDPDAVIFFEPMIITSTGIPSSLPPIQDARAVYFPHFYQVEVHEGYPYSGWDGVIRQAQSNRAAEAAAHGVPWMLGEFGVAETTGNFAQYLDDLFRVLDEKASGWTYWSYDRGGGFSILDEDGNEKPNLAPLIRTYPQKVAGRIRAFSYDPATRRFELTFLNREGVTGATEIHVPASRVYGGSFQVTCTDPQGAWSHNFDPDREVLSVRTDPGSSTHTVVIGPE